MDVAFNMGGDLSWMVSGTDIPTSGTLSNLNLGVSGGGTGLSALVQNIDGSMSYVQINVKHNGAFPYELALSVTPDKVNAGYYANLYYNNETTKELEFQGAACIGTDGTAEFVFDHASTYVIIVSAESHVLSPKVTGGRSVL